MSENVPSFLRVPGQDRPLRSQALVLAVLDIDRQLFADAVDGLRSDMVRATRDSAQRHADVDRILGIIQICGDRQAYQVCTWRSRDPDCWPRRMNLLFLPDERSSPLWASLADERSAIG